ncbi:hypothetical protein [Paraburkholderia lacunae]|uniref:hypothetical protein n=1 Tax=Paraburkholderia lacunae TaxID=2211104 RepID=UPI001402AB3D|nr:hypothetical protein [Paraburkholderia lacunae]
MTRAWAVARLRASGGFAGQAAGEAPGGVPAEVRDQLQSAAPPTGGAMVSA